jgi:guanylate kinase
MNIGKMIKKKIIIISSPSGAGKTTICNKIINKNKNIKLSISYTSRPIRKNEKHGIDYFFVEKKKFIDLNNKDYFIETAKVFNYLYGSPYENINKAFNKGKHILFDIDWQGANKLRKKFSKNNIIDFFILPPSKTELKKRLMIRGRESQIEIKKRLSLAVKEISHYNEYKYVLVNDNIEQTVVNILKIIQYEELLLNIYRKVKSVKMI